jgi:F-type H+-transporting ATPase subunit b
MKTRAYAFAAILAGTACLGVSLTASETSAQTQQPAQQQGHGNQPAPGPQIPQGHPNLGNVRPAPRPGAAADPHGAPAARGAAAPGAAHGAAPAGHGAAGHGEEHGAHGEHDEKAPPPPINWWHGLLGEKAGETPSILWRAPGEPAPFLASVINFAILLLIVNKYGKKALADALVKRKENITREIDDATRMRKAAEDRLAQYEAKLEKISDELDRVRREFREQGERDKERIIAEAKDRRERMRKDTEIILSQEVKQMRHELLTEVVRDATRMATEILSKNTTLGDHDRVADAFLHQLRSNARFSVAPAPPARGGSTYPGPAAAKGSPS